MVARTFFSLRRRYEPLFRIVSFCVNTTWQQLVLVNKLRAVFTFKDAILNSSNVFGNFFVCFVATRSPCLLLLPRSVKIKGTCSDSSSGIPLTSSFYVFSGHTKETYLYSWHGAKNQKPETKNLSPKTRNHLSFVELCYPKPLWNPRIHGKNILCHENKSSGVIGAFCKRHAGTK